MKGALTRDRIRADVAEVLDLTPGQVVDDVSLLEQGMDSIRLMTLLELWRSRGAEIDFISLADEPTVVRWLALLGDAKPG